MQNDAENANRPLAAGGGAGFERNVANVCAQTHYNTTGPESQEIELVKTAIQKLLTGDTPPTIPTDYAGAWADELNALVVAHRAGGRDAARRAFDALARARPDLAGLIAGDTEHHRFTSWAELLTMQFPEPVWAIPKLLPVGLTFLAGRPKLGKSWLALQIAQAVATGGVALGERVQRGNVLYLALEDSLCRIRERGKLQGMPPNAAVAFADRWDALMMGGLATLQAELDRTRPRLVVLDTFSRVAGNADQQDVSEMTAILANLQRAAQDHNAAILCIDHHRKRGGFETNAIDDILGSTAKSAVADAVWGLYRDWGAHNATLHVVGRDLEEREIDLSFDGATMTWQIEGDATEVRQSAVRANVLQAIRELTEVGEPATTAAIAAHLNANKGTVSHGIAELLKQGKIERGEGKGRAKPYILTQQ